MIPGLAVWLPLMSPSAERMRENMSKYIVHPGTLTVIDADECLIIDIGTDLSDEERSDLDGDDYFDDSLICEYAEQRGRPVAAATA